MVAKIRPLAGWEEIARPSSSGNSSLCTGKRRSDYKARFWFRFIPDSDSFQSKIWVC